MARSGFTPDRRTVPANRATRVKAVLDDEEAAGLHTLEGHAGFAREVMKIKSDLARVPSRRGRARARSVAGYGAPGKGNTLLNHCGIRADLLAYTVDRSPSSRESSSRGRTSRSMRPSAWPRHGPTTSSSCHGISGTRSPSSLTTSASWGGQLVFPIPALEIV